MPRIPHFGALLGVAVCLCAPGFAQQSGQKSAQQSAAASAAGAARVQHIVVRGTGDAMEVEIQTSGGAVAPDTQAITGPDRIVVDFPGALPAAELRALKVNQGPLKGVRSGLFFSNPAITRVVLDLTGPQSYRIATGQNAVVVKLGSGKSGSERSIAQNSGVNNSGVNNLGVNNSGANDSRAGNPSPAAVRVITSDALPARTVKLQNASLASRALPAAAVSRPTPVAAPQSPAALPAAEPLPAVTEAQPAKPLVVVTFADGMLRIHSDKATMAQVLYEVHLQTQAEIPIPAGAEQEQVVADLGPAPARDVLASLLNGSSYNFIFIGNEQVLEQVILTRRDPNNF